MVETVQHHHEYVPRRMKQVLAPPLRLPYPITERYAFSFVALDALFASAGESALYEEFTRAYDAELGAPQPARPYDAGEFSGWLYGDENPTLDYVGAITTLRVPAIYSQCVTLTDLGTELPALFLRRLAVLLGRGSSPYNLPVFLDFFRRFPALKAQVAPQLDAYRHLVDTRLGFHANGLGSFHSQGDHVLFFKGSLDIAHLEKNMGGMGFAFKVGRCGGYGSGRSRAHLTVVSEHGELLEHGYDHYTEFCDRVRVHHTKARLRALLT